MTLGPIHVFCQFKFVSFVKQQRTRHLLKLPYSYTNTNFAQMSSILEQFYVTLANGRLLEGVPPREESGESYFYSDVCFENPTVYCNTLMPGHREVVASWYLTPERLAKETVWVTLAYVLALVAIVPRLLCPIDVKVGAKSLRPHAAISLVSMACLALQTYYKVFDPSAYPVSFESW